ncbi:hypothetical protein B0H15DRAFT_1020697 [Mycena belliarum]|uniref:Uncharacterized protein n=1 Tax=Mycena belliarum TaxID=1033014 RepID=A0AAD6U7R5_9AGAR|nr:hypothetical protein B0H15DRAFT_1020697 [Mycena belliae]
MAATITSAAGVPSVRIKLAVGGTRGQGLGLLPHVNGTSDFPAGARRTGPGLIRSYAHGFMNAGSNPRPLYPCAPALADEVRPPAATCEASVTTGLHIYTTHARGRARRPRLLHPPSSFDTSVAAGIADLPTAPRTPVACTLATDEPHAQRRPRIRGSGTAAALRRGVSTSRSKLTTPCPHRPRCCSMPSTLCKSRCAPPTAPAIALSGDMDCLSSCRRVRALLIQPNSAPRVTPTSPTPYELRPLGPRELATDEILLPQRTLRAVRSPGHTEPRTRAARLPSPSIPPALLRSPPNDIRAARAAPPATPRFGVHARLLVVMWCPQVPRSARKSANAQFAHLSTNARSSRARVRGGDAASPSTAARPPARPGQRFPTWCRACVAPRLRIAYASRCAARAQLPANSRVAVLARVRTVAPAASVLCTTSVVRALCPVAAGAALVTRRPVHNASVPQPACLPLASREQPSEWREERFFSRGHCSAAL